LLTSESWFALEKAQGNCHYYQRRKGNHLARHLPKFQALAPLHFHHQALKVHLVPTQIVTQIKKKFGGIYIVASIVRDLKYINVTLTPGSWRLLKGGIVTCQTTCHIVVSVKWEMFY